MSLIKYKCNVILLSFLLSCIFLFSSCSSKEASLIIPPEKKITTEELYRDANTAFNTNNFAMAEDLYKDVLRDPSFHVLYRTNIYRRLIEIGKKRSDYQYMLSYLEIWNREDSNAILDEYWFTSMIEALVGFSDQKAIDKANALLTVPQFSAIRKQEISVLIAYLYWKTQQPIPAISLLEILWQEPLSDEQRASLENILFSYLERTDESITSILSATVTPSNIALFPYSIFALNQAKRFEKEGNTVDAKKITTELLKNNGLFSKKLSSIITAENKKKSKKINSKNIVLLLPMSSSYKQIAWKIINGATIAKEHLHARGNVSIHFINTDSADWLQKVQEFPYGTIVGGAIQQSIIEVAYKAGLFDKYVFFAFSSKLPENIEGKKAWRFFNAPADQVNALLNFTTSLGLSSYGIFSPQDNYGKAMTSLFTIQAKSYKSSVVAQETYPGNANTWNSLVGKLLSSSFIDDEPVPNAKFVATFIPDTFYQATVLVPSFFFHGEQRQVILGPSLWEQDIQKHSFVESNFKLAIFPGVLNPRSSEPAVQYLRNALKTKQLPEADLWSVLGYDFIRFAFEIRTKIFSLNHEDINAILSSSPLKKWAMAPILWSKNGLATQKLFILRPTPLGPRLVVKNEFYKQLEESYKAHNSRIEGILLKGEKK